MLRFKVKKEQNDKVIDAKLVNLIRNRILELYAEMGTHRKPEVNIEMVNGVIRIAIDKPLADPNAIHIDEFRKVSSLDEFRGVQKEKSTEEIIVGIITEELPNLLLQASAVV